MIGVVLVVKAGASITGEGGIEVELLLMAISIVCYYQGLAGYL